MGTMASIVTKDKKGLYTFGLVTAERGVSLFHERLEDEIKRGGLDGILDGIEAVAGTENGCGRRRRRREEEKLTRGRRGVFKGRRQSGDRCPIRGSRWMLTNL